VTSTAPNHGSPDGPRPEPERRALHAYLSDDAHERWHDIAADLGVSVSALLESMAADLDEGGGIVIGPHFEETVRRARRIDAERRRR
jgi:hypothetical protein